MNLKDILIQYRDECWADALGIADTDPDAAVICHARADTLNDVIRIIDRKDPVYLFLKQSANERRVVYGEYKERGASQRMS